MPKWDYAYHKIKDNDLKVQIEELKQLGAEGWELVMIRKEVDVEGAVNALFRRPID